MDTTFYEGDYVFNLRVGCVIRSNNKILIHQEIGFGHSAYIGGRAHIMEDIISAGLREIKEETGYEAEFVRELAMIENFFEDKGKKFHEILMVIEYKFKSDEIDENFEVLNIEEDKDIKYEWVDIDDLERVNFKPDIARTMDYSKPFSHYIQR